MWSQCDTVNQTWQVMEINCYDVLNIYLVIKAMEGDIGQWGKAHPKINLIYYGGLQ